MRYVANRLHDRAMDLIVDHVVKKYGLTEQTALYGPDHMAQVFRVVDIDFNLYVVSHGADDLPVMMRLAQGSSQTRFDMLQPKVFARELYAAIPPGSTVQVKLAMCYGATRYTFKAKAASGKTVSVTNSFASMTANQLGMLIAEDPLGRNLDPSRIFIGGGFGAAYWDKDQDQAPRFKVVDDPLPGLAPATITFEKQGREYYSPGVFAGHFPVPKSTIPNTAQDANVSTFCYFPFMFPLKKPLEARTSVPGSAHHPRLRVGNPFSDQHLFDLDADYGGF